MSGTVHVAGVYSATISATNADGTGTATLVITATDSIIPPPGAGITVIPSKVWSDLDDIQLAERSDYADIDDAGHAIASFDTDSIAAAQLAASAISNKIAALGGPGQVGQLVLPNNLTLAIEVRFAQVIGTVTIPGVSLGDPVLVNELQLPPDANGVVLPPDPITNILYYGTAKTNLVTIFAFNGNGVTLLANSRVNFRVFSFPNG